MTRRASSLDARTTLALAAGVVAAGVVVYAIWPSDRTNTAKSRSATGPVRPAEPPVEGRDVPATPPPMPKPPPRDRGKLAAIYQAAREAGEAKPGDKAFRATVDAYIDFNRALAEEQAAAEGITVPEVRELTYLGLLAQQTTRWPEVEALLGRELSADERTAVEEMMNASNAAFKRDMRALVAAGGDEDARWQLIYATEQNYIDRYLEMTGMTPALLDDLLAGDLTRDYAPAATPPPDDVPPAPAPEPPGPRPDRTP